MIASISSVLLSSTFNSAPIQFVGSWANGAGADVTLSGITPGMLIVAFAGTTSSTTVPTVASGFTNRGSAVASTDTSAVLATKVAVGGETTISFAGCTRLVVSVYRNVNSITVSAPETLTGSTTIQYGAQTITDPRSWVVVGRLIRNNTSIVTAASALTYRQTFTSGFGRSVIADSGGPVSSWPADSARAETLSGTSSGHIRFGVVLS